MKIKLAIFLFILLTVNVFADSIDGVEITSNVRLGEKIAVRGQYNDPDSNAFELCKFEIKEALDGNYIERWSDEYTFMDGTFYAERKSVEPPYYRGDDFNVVVTCGTASTEQTFTINQPTSLAHPIQSGWEYYFEESNMFAITGFVSFMLIILGVIIVGTFFLKRGRHYAGI